MTKTQSRWKWNFYRKLHLTLKLQYGCMQVFTWLQKSVFFPPQALAFLLIKFILKLTFCMGAPGLHSTSSAAAKERAHFCPSQGLLSLAWLGSSSSLNQSNFNHITRTKNVLSPLDSSQRKIRVPLKKGLGCWACKTTMALHEIHIV